MLIKFESSCNLIFGCVERRVFSLTAAITGVFILVITNAGAKLNLPLFQGLVGYVLCGLGAILCLFGLHINRVRKPKENVEPTRINNKELILNWVDELDRPYGSSACHVITKNEEGQENSYLYHLCDELLVSFFSLLDPISLIRLGLTCTKFHNLLQDKDLHRKIDLFYLAKTILNPLSNQPYCFDNYFTALMCAKVAKYFLSIHLTEEAYKLAGNVMEMIEQQRSPNRKYTLCSKLQDFNVDLPFSSDYDLEIMEEHIDSHYCQKKVTTGMIQHIKCIFFSMIAKDSLKKGDHKQSLLALNKAKNLLMEFYSNPPDFDDPHLILSTWKSLTKGMIHSKDLKNAQKLLNNWILKCRHHLESSFNKHTMLTLWIDFALQLYLERKHKEADSIFEQIEGIIFRDQEKFYTNIGNLLKVRLGVKLAYAMTKIDDMKACRQILIAAINLWDGIESLSDDIFHVLAKISLIIDPHNTLSISNLIDIACDDKKAQIRILLKSVSH